MPGKDDIIALREYHVDEKEKGDPSEVTAVPIIPNDVEDATTTAAQPYRLYKRRWFGVFALVSTP